MVLSALNLRTRDLVILRYLRDDMQSGMSKAEIQMKLREAGMNVTERDVQTSLDGMLNKGYVRKDQSQSPVMWSATPFAGQVSADVSMNWTEVVEDTKEVAKQALDVDEADEYIDRFCRGDGLRCSDPFTGKVIDIEESSELKDEIDRRIEIEEGTLRQASLSLNPSQTVSRVRA